MIKQCAICGNDFDAKTRAKYCPACRPSAYRKLQRELARHWREQHPGYSAEKNRIWREQHPDKYRAQKEKAFAKYQLKRKKARLHAILQANAAKRQAELIKHEKLYPSMRHWDNELPTISF